MSCRVLRRVKRLLSAVLTLIGFVALMRLAPDFDPVSLSDHYRNDCGAAFLVLFFGAYGFLFSFAPSERDQ